MFIFVWLLKRHIFPLFSWYIKINIPIQSKSHTTTRATGQCPYERLDNTHMGDWTTPPSATNQNYSPHISLNSSIIPFPFWIHEAKMKMIESNERTHANNKTIKAKKTLVRWESFLGMNFNSGMTWGLLSKLGSEGGGCFYIVSATHNSWVLGGVQYSYTHILREALRIPDWNLDIILCVIS
jgi:hypothetical protein